MMKKNLIIIFILLFTAGAFAEGLDTLIDVGKHMKDVEQGYKEETKNFENIKSALDNGSLKTGEPKYSVRKKYGDPVIDLPKDANGPEKWVYKPASSSYFEGIKIYLYFDDVGNLKETKIINQDEKTKK